MSSGVWTGTAGACPSWQISHSVLHVNRLWKPAEEISCSESDQTSQPRSKSCVKSLLCLPVVWHRIVIVTFFFIILADTMSSPTHGIAEPALGTGPVCFCQHSVDKDSGWVNVSIRKEINTVINAFYKTKYRVNDDIITVNFSVKF